MDPKPLNRVQLARICGNDPEAIRLLERLFQVAGQITPDQVQDLLLGQVSAHPVADDVRHDLAHVRQELGGLAARLDELALGPVQRDPARSCYGQFLQTATQTAALPATAYPVPFDVSDMSVGVYLNGTQIRVAQAGIYDFQISVQLDKTSGGLGHFYVWFAKNGTAIPNSGSTVRVQGNNAEVFSAVNLFISMSEIDYVQVMWAVDNVSVEMVGFGAAPPVPAIPAMILTINNNIEGVKWA